MAGIFDLFNERKAKLEAMAATRAASKKANAKIRIKPRIDEVLDRNSAKVLFAELKTSDPLEFPGYREKLENLQRRTGNKDAAICKVGAIDGRKVICVELTPEFMMGSMGTVVGETVALAAEYAFDRNMPLITFAASGGARMQEGMFSLMQMAKTAAAVGRLKDAGGLYISVLTHPTTGGVTASFATLGDIILAEPGALIGFAGPRVIEQTIGSKLPEGFQSSEFQLKHGFVDAIVERRELRKTLTLLLRLHDRPSAGVVDSEPNNTDAQLPGATAQPRATFTAQEHVELARRADRPHVRTFIDGLFDNFIEIHGDRLYGDDGALLTGLATFEGRPVTVAGHVKGSDLPSNIDANFGMPHPEGYRKFIRAIKQAEKFGRPVVTFIDTPGAYPGAEAEQRGQGQAIAECLEQLSGLRVPIVALLTGEGGSGGALALGLADVVIMFEHAIYSVLSPEGFASILWKDAKLAPKAAEVMKLTADELLAAGMVEQVLPEPVGSIAADPTAAIEVLRTSIAAALNGLAQLDSSTLLSRRYNRYRRFR